MPKTLWTALTFTLVACGVASGASLRSNGAPPLTFAANGCGPGAFRTLAGECVPNRRITKGPDRGAVLPPPCPRGYLRDPDPARPLCYPVY